MLLRVKRKVEESFPNEYEFKNKKFKHLITTNEDIPKQYSELPLVNVPLKNVELDIQLSELRFEDSTDYVYDYYMVEEDYTLYPSDDSDPSEIDYPDEVGSSDASCRHFDSELSQSWEDDDDFDFESSDFDEMNDIPNLLDY